MGGLEQIENTFCDYPAFKDFYEHWSDDEFDESEDSDDDDIDDDFELYDLDEGNLLRGIDNCLALT